MVGGRLSHRCTNEEISELIRLSKGRELLEEGMLVNAEDQYSVVDGAAALVSLKKTGTIIGIRQIDAATKVQLHSYACIHAPSQPIGKP